MTTTTHRVALRIPTRLPWQSRVVAEARRFNVPVVGRRGGKTELCQDLIAEPDRKSVV